MRTKHQTSEHQAGLFTEEQPTESLPEEAIRGMVMALAKLLLGFLQDETPDGAERSEHESQDYV